MHTSSRAADLSILSDVLPGRVASQGISQGNLPSTIGELSTVYFDKVVVPI